MTLMPLLASTADYMSQIVRIRPELALVMTLLVVLVFDLLTRGRESWHAGTISIIGLLGTLYFLVLEVGLLGLDRMSGGDARTVFGMVRVDEFAVFFKIFVTAAVLVVMTMSLEFKGFRKHGFGEYYFILLCATLGCFFVVSTQNLLLLVLSLELLGISAYVLTGYLKRDRRSAEAALKYVIFGAVATGSMLYGVSLLYGLCGTLDLSLIAERLQASGLSDGREITLGISILLILVGLGYKIAIVPFHFWAPDVYEGAPTPVTTFLAVASKAVGFAALIRVLMGTLFIHTGDDLITRLDYAGKVTGFLAVLAAITMTYGNFAALRQTNLKRLLAYSSIAHAGYVLCGVCVLNAVGLRAAVFYLVTYYFMTLAAFGVVIYFSNRTGREDLAGLSMLGWRYPLVGIVMVIALVSLTGIPPTAGFFGKYYLIKAMLEANLVWLAVVMALNAVVALFYYFRIVKSLFFGSLGPEPETHYARNPGLTALLGVLSAGTILIFIFPRPVDSAIHDLHSESEVETPAPIEAYEVEGQKARFFGIRIQPPLERLPRDE